jgi:hypothetical protein
MWYGVPAGRIAAVAAAGVRAIVPGRPCQVCTQALSLWSRDQVDQLLRGDTASATCVDCDQTLLKTIARRAAAGAVEGYARMARRNREREILARAEAVWRAKQDQESGRHAVVRRFAELVSPNPENWIWIWPSFVDRSWSLSRSSGGQQDTLAEQIEVGCFLACDCPLCTVSCAR